MKAFPIAMILALITTACNEKTAEPDAYGNFEAAEVVVSAETSGRIISFKPAEGSQIKSGDEIALIDTTMLWLQKSEIEAGIKSVRTRIVSIDAQNEVLIQQIANLDVNIRRIENMLRDDAATRKQLDDLTGQAEVIRKQIAASNSQKLSTAAEINVLESRKAAVVEQLLRCRVLSPISGTIIEKYSEEGEITSAGRPLIKIADLSVVKLKAYVGGSQLGSIKHGQECTVRIDDGEKGFRNYTGKISHIAEKAEFTPKIIQTREERVTLVYAVNISVVNDGGIKAGMPGEAIFNK